MFKRCHTEIDRKFAKSYIKINKIPRLFEDVTEVCELCGDLSYIDNLKKEGRVSWILSLPGLEFAFMHEFANADRGWRRLRNRKKHVDVNNKKHLEKMIQFINENIKKEDRQGWSKVDSGSVSNMLYQLGTEASVFYSCVPDCEDGDEIFHAFIAMHPLMSEKEFGCPVDQLDAYKIRLDWLTLQEWVKRYLAALHEFLGIACPLLPDYIHYR